MKYQPIQANEFTSFVRTLQGQEIPTTSRKRIFTIDVVRDDMNFTPMSSGKVRPHPHKYVEKVLNSFNETQSFTQTAYRDDGIVNAAYMLTLISMYIEADKRVLHE